MPPLQKLHNLLFVFLAKNKCNHLKFINRCLMSDLFFVCHLVLVKLLKQRLMFVVKLGNLLTIVLEQFSRWT